MLTHRRVCRSAARVQLAMGLFTCCCPSKPGPRQGGSDGEVCSGEQNIAAGCISGDPHNPRFEMTREDQDRVAALSHQRAAAAQVQRVLSREGR